MWMGISPCLTKAFLLGGILRDRFGGWSAVVSFLSLCFCAATVKENGWTTYDMMGVEESAVEY